MKTVKNYYRVDRRKIHFLKFILEAYDGIALMSTLDSRQGEVVLCIAPGCESEVAGIIEDLSRSIRIEAYRPETGIDSDPRTG